MYYTFLEQMLIGHRKVMAYFQNCWEEKSKEKLII